MKKVERISVHDDIINIRGVSYIPLKSCIAGPLDMWKTCHDMQ